MIYCLNCGKTVEEDKDFCPSCGAYIPWELINPQRKEYANNRQEEMPTYRYNQQAQAHPDSAKNKWVSLVLCFFLGVFGAHRFYEGKVGTGLLYLFTGGFCGIGVFVDLIILLGKPNPYYVN